MGGWVGEQLLCVSFVLTSECKREQSGDETSRIKDEIFSNRYKDFGRRPRLRAPPPSPSPSQDSSASL